MIAPKLSQPTAAEERAAYRRATERDRDLCVRCRRGGVAHRDHRQNRQPGNTVVSNLQLLCVSCHEWKTGHPLLANEQGWGVPAWADPKAYPAARWVAGVGGTVRLLWVLYDDACTWEVITAEEAEARREGHDWPTGDIERRRHDVVQGR